MEPMAPSQNDAMLMVELSKLGALLGIPEAGRTIFASDFDPDEVDISEPAVQKILNFNETIATLVENNLLDRDLVHDLVWVSGIWERVGPAARRARIDLGSDALYENFEALATQTLERKPGTAASSN
jgi:Domain of unknown function (DUF4760)